MTDFIPVNVPLLGQEEKDNVIDCLESGWISSEGEYVRRFEDEFAKSVRRKYAVSCSNGSAALDISIKSLDIGEGDEVIMPTFTIISCMSAVVRAGGKPVFVDCNAETWNMDEDLIESYITHRTVAIMAVHIYGLTSNMNRLVAIADKYNLLLIEDAAQAIGAESGGKPCGSYGNVSTFSFYPNKHITTGEGGMVVTDDEIVYRKALSLRNLCFNNEKRFIHDDIGWNYRLTNLQAALGLGQLTRIDQTMAKKYEIGLRYYKAFQGISSIKLPLLSTSYSKNTFWVFGILFKAEAGTTSAMARSFLQNEGIGTRPFFYPMHKQPITEKLGYGIDTVAPNSEYLYEYGFYIPSGVGLSNSQQENVIGAVHRLLSYVGLA